MIQEQVIEQAVINLDIQIRELTLLRETLAAQLTDRSSRHERIKSIEETIERLFGKKIICSHCGKEMRERMNKIFGTKKRPLCWIHRCK